MDKNDLLRIIQGELEPSTGCTDPGSVALAVARATQELGAASGGVGSVVDSVEVTVSPSVFKNGVGVGIPGTGMRGLAIAAALGAVIGHPEAGLAIFEGVDPTCLEEAKALVGAGKVCLGYADSPDPLYVSARVRAGAHEALAIIAGDYSNIVEVALDGRTILSAPIGKALEAQDALAGCRLEELFGLVGQMGYEDLGFLLEAAQTNLEAANLGLADPSLHLGASLAGRAGYAGRGSGRGSGASPDQGPALPQPFAAMHQAQVWTAAASEARMAGLPVTVMAIAGSGNHGITFSLGILAVAKTLGASREATARALAYGALVTVVIKSQVHRMTAFCGCSVAASTGVAAGAVYLLGGDFAASERAMQSVIGTLAGMLCDGAKESCAWKLSTSASLAIQSAYAALEGASIPSGMGIVGRGIDASFANLGELNEPGMVATNRLVLELIERNSAPGS